MSGENIKINSSYYQENVIRSIYIEKIPFVYPKDFQKVKLHEDKVTNSASKITTAFLEKK